ncbi:MAG: peptide chain release factor-like protein [Candidatus Hydrogenedentes bacterium]|nr:peptide chain release factor-like protein [Candidatus Hydrogenedentota bacterium]
MSIFGVTPKKAEELRKRMAVCSLQEKDIEESFVHGGGPGGQKVNKSATAVVLRHRPSSLTVKTQTARSQALNRFYARRRLCELLEARIMGNDSPEARRREKIRKQKARRKRRTRNDSTLSKPK